MQNTSVFSTPEQILNQLQIDENMVVADFGCGSGFFAIPMAKKVTDGIVYALDVIKDSLEAVESKAKLEGISNIKTIHCNLEILGSSKLGDESVNLVLTRNILFQSQKKVEVLKEARRVLKSKASLVLIEWVPGSPLAPKEGWLISKEQARQLAEKEGFSLDKELDLDNQHYGLVFKK